MIYILAIIYWLIFEVIIVKGALAFRDAEKVERGEAPDSGCTFIPDILVFVPLFCATAWLIKWLAPGDAIVIFTALSAALCAWAYGDMRQSKSRLDAALRQRDKNLSAQTGQTACLRV